MILKNADFSPLPFIEFNKYKDIKICWIQYGRVSVFIPSLSRCVPNTDWLINRIWILNTADKLFLNKCFLNNLSSSQLCSLIYLENVLQLLELIYNVYTLHKLYKQLWSKFKLSYFIKKSYYQKDQKSKLGFKNQLKYALFWMVWLPFFISLTITESVDYIDR